jgi:sterol desaturase/sphingolipid hydroxylase (fatty acid hydroxylase superfamily)
MVQFAEGLANFFVGSILKLFVPLSSNMSAVSLLIALFVAAGFLLLKRPAGKKQVKYKVLLRALFPRWLGRASFKADIWFLLFNVFGLTILLGWAVISSQFVGNTVAAALTDMFGSVPATGSVGFTSRLIATVCLFLAYELAFWVDHYLSHRIPLLWEFHKVHHTAEVLSPITNFRMHPVDSVVWSNISALFIGATGGVLTYLHVGEPFTIAGGNLFLVAFILFSLHLQHSHVWIPATGRLGRVIFSPAHHQIHHSDNPIHYDRNFGCCLSLWDWMFGTLCVPERKRERLNFGVGTRERGHHTAMGSIVVPFVLAWGRLRSARIPPARSRVVNATDHALGPASAHDSAATAGLD